MLVKSIANGYCVFTNCTMNQFLPEPERLLDREFKKLISANNVQVVGVLLNDVDRVFDAR